MYYDRFGNTVDYLVANYPCCVANMSESQRYALARRQARIDYPCCMQYEVNIHCLSSTQMCLVAFRRLDVEGDGNEELLLAHAYFQRKEENRITMRDFPKVSPCLKLKSKMARL